MKIETHSLTILSSIVPLFFIHFFLFQLYKNVQKYQIILSYHYGFIFQMRIIRVKHFYVT